MTKGPIFIVGSPRSGTSILTWCLGQHPNLLTIEESNWMSSFAVDVGVAFRRGSMRGERSHLSSMGISRDRLMATIGRSINDSIITHRSAFLRRLERNSRPDAPENVTAIKLERRASDPKKRWVNGTPEYSFGIFGLRKLFPDARFIHIVRDCDQVALSMLHFDRIAGSKFAASAVEGYAHWQRYVRAVLDAEQACGPAIIRRIFFRDLVERSEDCLRCILEFIKEPFAAECLEPLTIKINSSRVESHSLPDNLVDDLTIKGARELWKKLKDTTCLPSQPEPAALARLAYHFEERIEYVYGVDHDLKERTEWAMELGREIAKRDCVIFDLQAESLDRTNWAMRLDKEIAQKDALITELQQTCEERTNWAFNLQAELDQEAVIIGDLLRKCAAQARDLASLRRQLKEKDSVLKTLQKKMQSRTNWIVGPLKWLARKLALAGRGGRRRPAI